MRPHTAALRALLDGWTPNSNIQKADLFTFTLAGGEVIRLSGFQIPVMAPPPPDPVTGLVGDSNVFPLGPPIDPVQTKVRIGTQVDEIEIHVMAGPNDTLALAAGATLNWQHAAWAGIFDGARVAVDRAFMTAVDGVVGTINWFTGHVGDVETGRTRLIMKGRSLLDLLTQQMPRRLYQAACTHVFGDAMCLFDRTTLAANVTAATADQNSVVAGLSPNPATLYDNGTILGLTGLNAGFRRTIGGMQGGTAFFLKPWIFPVAIGDQFQLLPGCDLTVATCDGTFGNIIHFGGDPYIPPPETAI
jgi:uncharacterized phage protein (TIGR02218 family)